MRIGGRLLCRVLIKKIKTIIQRDYCNGLVSNQMRLCAIIDIKLCGHHTYKYNSTSFYYNIKSERLKFSSLRVYRSDGGSGDDLFPTPYLTVPLRGDDRQVIAMG